MREDFSPIMKRIVGRLGLSPSPKRAKAIQPSPSSNKPTEVVLEEWWLVKNGEGLAVGGRVTELTRCHRSLQTSHSASARRGCTSTPLREFTSARIVKNHGCNTLEDCDGVLVFLCGLINKSRTLENGFSSEVCRDFLCGFPINWEKYTVADEQPTDEKLSHVFNDLDACSGVELRALRLGLTDSEAEILSAKVNDNLMKVLESQIDNNASVAEPLKTSFEVQLLDFFRDKICRSKTNEDNVRVPPSPRMAKKEDLHGFASSSQGVGLIFQTSSVEEKVNVVGMNKVPTTVSLGRIKNEESKQMSPEDKDSRVLVLGLKSVVEENNVRK